MIARVADTATSVELPDGVSLVRSNDPKGIRQLIEVHERVFDADQTQLGRTLLAQLSVAPDLNDIVLGFANGEPVASARVQFIPDCDFAGLWGGSTLPQWRGKGLFKAMVAIAPSSPRNVDTPISVRHRIQPEPTDLGASRFRIFRLDCDLWLATRRGGHLTISRDERSRGF